MASSITQRHLTTASQLSTWISDLSTVNLVALDQIAQGLLYRGTYSFATGLFFSGTTSDSTRYIHLLPAPGHEPRGVPGTGPIIALTAAPNNPTYILETRSVPHTIFEGIEVTYTGAATTNEVRGIRVTGQNALGNAYPSYVVGCIARDIDPVNAQAVGISLQGGRCFNSIAYNVGGAGGSNNRGISCAASVSEQTTMIVNCSVFSCRNNQFQATVNDSVAASIDVLNCLSVNGPHTDRGYFFSIINSNGTVRVANCLSTDTYAIMFGGSNNTTSIDSSAQFKSGTNLSLQTGSTARSWGSAMSTNVFPWGPDITGYDRYAAAVKPDSGAYQFVTPRPLRDVLARSALRRDVRR